MSRPTNRQAEPEVWFRIVHLAQVVHNRPLSAPYREHMVEIALGPKGAFENDNIGVLKLRAPPSRVVSMATQEDNLKPIRAPKTPRVVDLLQKATEWQDLLESGKVANQAEIASKEGISRARVTQVLGLLCLAPEIQEKIITSPGTIHRRIVTERMLRPIGAIADQREQVEEFHRVLI